MLRNTLTSTAVNSLLKCISNKVIFQSPVDRGSSSDLLLALFRSRPRLVPCWGNRCPDYI